ncbi:MAG TPA: hypothetical protein P5293_05710 [Bacteroidales bacterium]|nr:hypothetical protein [Bacteroidales bacterium]
MPRVKTKLNKYQVFTQTFPTPKATKAYFKLHYAKGAKIVGPLTWKVKNGNYVRLYLFGIEELKSIKHLQQPKTKKY